MKRILAVGGILIGVGLLVLLLLTYHFQVEQYQIIHTAYFSVTNKDLLNHPAVLCYSDAQLREAGVITNALDQACMNSFNSDRTDLIACIVPNYIVERIVGRQDIGFIVLRKSPTPGISFTLFKGTKRFLQFNYQDTR
jgi:hypothetical protein